jgi:glucose/arabinose dehydrogenase
MNRLLGYTSETQLPMSKNLIWLVLLLALVVSSGCLSLTPPPPPATPTPIAAPCDTSSEDEGVEDDCGDTATRHPPGGLPQLLPTPVPATQAPTTPPRVETVADGLTMPLGLVWTPDGRKLFFSEVKLGRIRLMIDGVLQPEPFVTLPIAKGAETGMLGLAIDPEYDKNHYVYAYHSEADSNRNHVLRFEDRDGRAMNQTEILRSVAISDRGGAHNAGRMAFGPDGMLYVSAGNGQNTKIGQDPCKLGGKVLRVTRDGQTPPDSPFSCSSAFALGFRNPFGLAFHPLTGALFATDNGGKGHDELNLVRREGNYGHSTVEGIAGDPRFVDPLWESGPISIGPTGLAFYTGNRLPEYKNDLFYCGVHTGQLSRVRLAAPAYEQIEAMNVEIMKEQVDCRLDVANGPDGSLYFANFSQIGRITR